MFFIPLPILLVEVLIFSTFVHFYNFWDVFFLYLLPSFVGAVTFSLMGKSMLLELQRDFAQGQLPGNRILHRAAVLVGSILLVIPLFLTRVLALILILPIFRHMAVFIFKTFIFKRMARSGISFFHFGGMPGGDSHGPQGFSRGPFPFEEQTARHERDAEVVNVTPIEITHTKIKDEDEKDPKSEN